MQLYTVCFICKLLYMFQAVSPPVPDAVDTVISAPDDGWRDHPKHVEQFTDKINCV